MRLVLYSAGLVRPGPEAVQPATPRRAARACC